MTDDPLIGRNLEKCRIISKLGMGGMGAVYLAEHEGLNRQVALKLLPAEMSRDPQFVARFMREATTLGRLEHPNIVRVHDVGHDSGRHFIVMQYIDGEALSSLVDEQGAMDPKDAARLIMGVLRGLQHAHQQGVIHRDIKPDNILVTREDEPKLLDFGLAIETETALKLTRDGLVVGTPYYVSPEQARGKSAVPQSDIYSAGVTLYYILTARRPFTGSTAMAVLNMHIHQRPIPPRTLRKEIPQPLNDIVMKMLEKRLERRYASAEEAADDLENFLEGRPVHARPARRFELTPKVMIGGGASGVALLILLIIALTSGGEPEIRPVIPRPIVNQKPPDHPGLREILAFQEQHLTDIKAYAEIFGKYRAFIASDAPKNVIARARVLESEFRDKVEKRADVLLGRIPEHENPADRLRALRAFPDELLRLTGAGDRVEKERARLGKALEERFRKDVPAIERMLVNEEFERARLMVESALDYANDSHRVKLEDLLKRIKELEAARRDPTLLKLTTEFGKAHKTFETLMADRKIADAYAVPVAFLRAHATPEEIGHTRVRNVRYEDLLSLDLRGFQADAGISDARVALATAWTGSRDVLAWRILTDLEDAIDVKWLFERAGSGLRKLSVSGAGVEMKTFGDAGRIDLDRTGYRFLADGGGKKPVVVSKLHPEDLIRVAALDQGQTLEKAFASNPTLARAGGVAFLHSRVDDRWTGAARWLAQADTLGAQGPTWRNAGILERGRREAIAAAKAAREAAQKALDQARTRIKGRRFSEAKKTLQKLAAQWKNDPKLSDDIGRALAQCLLAELKAAEASRNIRRIKQLWRELRDNHGGQYDDPGVRKTFQQVLFESGTQSRADMRLDHGFWSWLGQERKIPVPATDARHEGFLLKPGGVLLVEASKRRGATGLFVQARLKKGGRMGIFYEVSEEKIPHRVLAIEAPSPRVLVLNGLDPAGDPIASIPLKVPVKVNAWADLALILEGGDVVAYVERQPVLHVSGEAVETGALGIWSSVEANFREIYLRR